MTEGVFTQSDLETFADLSGDHNPIHVDPVAARRLLFGGQVVPGILALLWGLDGLARPGIDLRWLKALRVRFLKPVPVDAPVRLELVRRDVDGASLRLEVDGVIAATIRVGFHDLEAPPDVEVPTGRPQGPTPRELRPEEVAAAAGSVSPCVDRDAVSLLLPHVLRLLTLHQLSEILATTRIVGMECPGLHSIYSELDVTFEPAAECAAVRYRVTSWDERFSRVEMEVAGSGMRGLVTAFLRPSPKAQVGSSEIDQVTSGEFESQRALIVGGSRGLGEVAAKLLAAGGAAARITYFRGEEDARGVVEDITSSGGDAASLYWNVLAARPPDTLSQLGWVPTDLFYFASPFVAASGGFSSELFARFCDYYVGGFARTVQAVLDLRAEHGRVDRFRILYPSSVFLDELPADMSEYVAAKSAGEALCRSLHRRLDNVSITTPRLPRLATDQTRSLLGTEVADPVPVLLAELRRLRDM